MRRWVVAALVVPVVATLVGLAASSAPWPRAPKHNTLATVSFEVVQSSYALVPLSALLAVPERYEGRKVRVQGWATLGFEDARLHPDRASHDASACANGLLIDAPSPIRPPRAHWPPKGAYAEVSGTFRSGFGAGFGRCPGALEDVVRVEPLLTTAELYRAQNLSFSSFLVRQMLSPWFLTLFGWWGLWTAWGLRRASRTN